MKHFIHKLLLVAACTSSVATAKADEGMWPVCNPDAPLIRQMKAAGFQMEASSIYHPDGKDLRSSIVLFDNSGTGSFVSPDGLLLTNHHCVRDRIQKISTPDQNRIRNGYWATSIDHEIPLKGLTIKSLVKVIDVTNQVKDLQKKQGMRKIAVDLEKQYSDSVLKYSASLDAYSTGAYLISVYQTFADVRLVGVPPESIGNFGGDADNFEWPRHSADFAVLRVYANKQNLPAAFSPENRPYNPGSFLHISLKGVQENDFVLTIGFPFSTERYISSYQLREDLDVKNKATALAKGRYAEVLEQEMQQREQVRLKYSGKKFSAANSSKLAEGILEQISSTPAFEHKIRDEEALKQWIQSDSLRTKRYGEVLSVLKQNYRLQHDSKYAHAVLTAALFSDLTVLGIRARQILSNLEANKKAEKEKAIRNYSEWYNGFVKEYDADVERALLKAMLSLVRNEVAQAYLPPLFKTIEQQYQGDVSKYVDDMFNQSAFTKPEHVTRFLRSPRKSYLRDPLYCYGNEVYTHLIDLKKQSAPYGKEIARAEKLFNEAVREMKAGQTVYPDANFSMRLTYGTVCGAQPVDGLLYKSQTTLKGLLEKADSTKYDYYLWPKLKALYDAKEYGVYGQQNDLFTCFLSNTDITGGNSGSPVLNSKGELTGLAFDGIFESLAGSYYYDAERNRSVNVDIRYVLFIIDKFAGSNYIMNELKSNNLF